MSDTNPPPGCAYGHTKRVVGCVSCVLVFDRPAEKVGESMGLGDLWVCIICGAESSAELTIQCDHDSKYAKKVRGLNAAPAGIAEPDVHTTVNITETVNKMRIQSAIRAAFPGGCRLLSNASCDCLLCALDSLLALKDTQLQQAKMDLEFSSEMLRTSQAQWKQTDAQLQTLRKQVKWWQEKSERQYVEEKRLRTELEAAQQERNEAIGRIPTDAPVGEKLLLNSYGRRCYNAGADAAEAQIQALRAEFAAHLQQCPQCHEAILRDHS